MIIVFGSVVVREGQFAQALALGQEHVERSRAFAKALAGIA